MVDSLCPESPHESVRSACILRRGRDASTTSITVGSSTVSSTAGGERGVPGGWTAVSTTGLSSETHSSPSRYPEEYDAVRTRGDHQSGVDDPTGPGAVVSGRVTVGATGGHTTVCSGQEWLPDRCVGSPTETVSTTGLSSATCSGAVSRCQPSLTTDPSCRQSSRACFAVIPAVCAVRARPTPTFNSTLAVS